jgi:uncharacterized membrane protein YdjX (TVP38/TMEM64 family)
MHPTESVLGEKAGGALATRWRNAWPILALVAGSLFGGAALLWVGPGRILESLALAEHWITTHALPAYLLLFAWCLASQTICAPSGTPTMLAAGYLFGWPSAIAYFAAMLLTGVLIHGGVGGDMVAARAGVLARLQERFPKRNPHKWAEAAQREGVALSATLRLTPILPSAGVALAASALGVSAPAFLRGTLLAGWIRPLALALAGASAGSLTQLAAADALGLGSAAVLIAAATLAPMVLAARLTRRIR